MSEFIGEYNKLVRDSIPHIAEQDGLTVYARRLDDDEYEDALLQKLVEEATGAAESRGSLEELADVLEVVRAICKVRGYHMSDIDDTRVKKRERKGGFDDRVYLERIAE